MNKFDRKKYNKLLDTSKFGRSLDYFDTIDSTNEYSGRLIHNIGKNELQELDGRLILAEIQTSGRGRFKHKWLSPEGGLWFSLIIITDMHPEKLPNLTLIAAFSISEVLLELHGIDVDIKWPNDLYYGEYKFGGILSEFKNEKDFQAVILGIGINANIDIKDLDKLDNTATSLKNIIGKSIDREILLAKILDNFETSFDYFSRTDDFKSLFMKWENNIKYQ